MATHDDGLNFAYAYGNVSWNPALRPDSTEPQHDSIYSVPPPMPEDVALHHQTHEESNWIPPTEPKSNAPSSAVRYKLESDEPTSDEYFFDRYAPGAEPSSVQTGIQHQEAFYGDHMTAKSIAQGGSDPLQTTKDVVAEHEHPSQTVPPTTLSQDANHGWDQITMSQKPDHGYDFQGETTLLEESVQEKSTVPLIPNSAPTNIDWGMTDDTFDFDIKEEKTVPPVASSIPVADTSLSNVFEEKMQGSVPVSTQLRRGTSIDWGTSEGQEFDLGTTTTAAPAVTDVTKDTEAANPTATDKTEDISALWQAALGDDELLVDSAKDPWAALDDGEGFLEDTLQPSSEAVSESNNQTAATMNQRSISEGRPNKYAPAQAQQPTASKQPSNPYLPDRPQFTDFSQLNRPSSSSRAPVASPYQMVYAQQAPQRPTLPSSAESFANKSQAGYHSPYDLPDDLTTQPRRRPLHHAPSMPVLQSTLPPPRSSSMAASPSIGPPRAQPATSGASQNPTPPSSSHSSQAPSDFVVSKAVSPTKPADRRRSSEFFADLPDVRRTRHPTPSGRYAPMSPAGPTPPLNPALPISARSSSAAVPTLRPQASVPSLASQLRQPEKIPLYNDEQPTTGRSVTMPAPPQSTRYSPMVPSAGPALPSAPPALPSAAPALKSRYSPAPTSAPTHIPPAAARYSPAPTATATHYGYAPRTSSPLAFSSLSQQQVSQQQATPPTNEPTAPSLESPVYQRSSFDRSSSLTGQLPLEPVSEDGPFIPTPPSQSDSSILPNHALSPRSATPPTIGQRSGPPSTVSSPRKRTTYTPQHASLGSLSELNFGPPPRSHTSSPGKLTRQPAKIAPDRPASAHGQLPLARDFTAPAVIQTAPKPTNSVHEANLIPPQNENANDPLQRWKGAPIFNWASGGIVVTSFPQYTPRYGSGFIGPAIQPTPGVVKIRNTKDVLPQPDVFGKFPGPLKKGKKKEVSTWLKSSIEELEKYNQSFIMQSGLPGVDIRMEEKVLLWKVVALMVDHDGVLEGKPDVDEAVRNLLAIAPPVDPPGSAGGLNGNQASVVLPDAFDANVLATLRTHLYQGEREKAVWHAVDQRLWAHALLIASTLPPEIWKQVVQEFVRKEISKAGDINQPVAALYQIFAGNWEESIDELVSVSARAGFHMISTGTGGAPKDALAGLNKWRDTLLLVLNNRSPNDVNALLALGRLLRGYGRIEAAHICFIFARSVAYFGSSGDPQADFTLLGSNPFTQGSDLGRDLDSVLLSEAYEFALTLSASPVTPVPHLQAFKLYHAEILTETGHRAEAQQYCDAIASIIHSKTKPSPYFNVYLMQRLDELSKRLSQAPVDGSSWKPSMDKMSSSLLAKFNSFVTGEDSNDAASNASGQGTDTGNFIRMKGDTPDLSRQASGADLYSAMMSNGVGSPGAPVNSRYAPVSTSSARTSLEQPSLSRYTPTAQSSYQPRSSQESSRSTQEPSLTANSAIGVGLPVAPQRSASYNASMSPQNPYAPISSFQATTGSHAPQVLPPEPVISTSPYTPSPYQPTPPEDTLDVASLQPSLSFNSYQPVIADESTSSYQPPSFDTYQPPTSSYEPPASDEPIEQTSYEPTTSYQPYEPSSALEETETSSPEEPKPKKKSFMDDDDDDDLLARAEALKKQKRADADRQADEAFRKAAEADAARPSANADKKGWFGGWWGGKKDADIPQTGPIKAKLGEGNSFVFDKELGRWVNKKAGAADAAPVAEAPPPPKATPRPASALAANGGLAPPPMSTPPVGAPPVGIAAPPPMAAVNRAASVPPVMMARQDSAASSGSAPPPLAGGSSPALASGGPLAGPPSRPATSMSNASDLDDLLGAPAGRRGPRKTAQRKGRYVDVMANQK